MVKKDLFFFLINQYIITIVYLFIDFFMTIWFKRDILLIIEYIYHISHAKMQENLLHEHTSFIHITLDNARWVGGVTKKFRKINVTQADTSWIPRSTTLFPFCENDICHKSYLPS